MVKPPKLLSASVSGFPLQFIRSFAEFAWKEVNSGSK